jgi:hypothetical protein
MDLKITEEEFAKALERAFDAGRDSTENISRKNRDGKIKIGLYSYKRAFIFMEVSKIKYRSG